MDHLRQSWQRNFNRHPELNPKYILPNKCSIVRCLSENKGFAIIPDFLCRHELQSGKAKLVWEGEPVIENTLYFGKRKKTNYAEEIRLIEGLFQQHLSH